MHPLLPSLAAACLYAGVTGYQGLRLARRLLVDINDLGMPAGTEYLDLIDDIWAGLRAYVE